MANRAKAKSAKASKGKVKGKPIATLPKGARRGKRKGDNGGPGVRLGLSDEMKERWMKQLRAGLKSIALMTADIRQERSVYSNLRKAAKKEGFSLAGFDILERERNRDLGHVHQDYADAAELVKIDGGPLLEQLSLFQNMIAPEPVVDVALQGLNAGKNAESVDNCPYPPGSENFILWRDNWELGQQKNREGLNS